jgi:muramoyltetrapeptide carboxypeptidase LdcA involved in peptidoglycan recycling
MIMEHDNTRWIDERFAAMGLTLTFGEHVDEDDQFRSGSVEHRVADLHAAFADPAVAGILTVIGGFNSNELLPHLDFDLVAAHPKVLCGYSDITALQNAILARAGVVTYSGPHWSSWGMRDHFEPTGDWFRAAVMDDAPIAVEPAQAWTDDLWFADQDARTPVPNEGWWTLRPGQTSGRIVGGNLGTLGLLQGTAYMPSLDGALLFLEDDFESDPAHVARQLTSLLQLPDADRVAGLVVGRFQVSSGVSREALDEIVARQPALRGKPVLAGVDLGHTSPLLTFPVGGEAELVVAADGGTRLTITRH